MKKLEMVQRRSARYVLNRFNYLSSVDEMLQELQWNTLEERRKKDRLVMFYKILNDPKWNRHWEISEAAGSS